MHAKIPARERLARLNSMFARLTVPPAVRTDRQCVKIVREHILSEENTFYRKRTHSMCVPIDSVCLCEYL